MAWPWGETGAPWDGFWGNLGTNLGTETWGRNLGTKPGKPGDRRDVPHCRANPFRLRRLADGRAPSPQRGRYTLALDRIIFWCGRKQRGSLKGHGFIRANQVQSTGAGFSRRGMVFPPSVWFAGGHTISKSALVARLGTTDWSQRRSPLERARESWKSGKPIAPSTPLSRSLLVNL